MSDDDFSGFEPPAFNADEALQRLKRQLRELGLAEREGRFERRGVSIAKAAADGAVIKAAVVKKPSRNSPEWAPKSIRSSADLRDFVADLERKLVSWSDRDD